MPQKQTHQIAMTALRSVAPASGLATRGLPIPQDEIQELLSGIRESSNSAMARDIAGGLMEMRAFSSIYSNALGATVQRSREELVPDQV
jgi:hypothetical protein